MADIATKDVDTCYLFGKAGKQNDKWKSDVPMQKIARSGVTSLE